MANEEKSKFGKIPAAERPFEVEQAPEEERKITAPEREEKRKPEKVEIPSAAAALPAAVKPAVLPPKDPVLVQIESILEEDLQDLYRDLPPELKPKFKQKGEEAARVIRDMIARAKVKARKVLKLLTDWLKMIPGVNKFFLEQEAALKAQKIMMLAEKDKKEK